MKLAVNSRHASEKVFKVGGQSLRSSGHGRGKRNVLVVDAVLLVICLCVQYL